MDPQDRGDPVLVVQNPRLTTETDHTELRLRAATGPVQKRLHFIRVGQFALTIPAGAGRHEIEAGSSPITTCWRHS